MRVVGPDGPQDVDTGFIVFNEERYPNFVKLRRKLDVPSHASRMSFAQFFTNHRFLDVRLVGGPAIPAARLRRGAQ